MFRLGTAGRQTCVRQVDSLEVDIQQNLLNIADHEKELIRCT